MTILSQDKTRLVNADQVEWIGIRQASKDDASCTVYAMARGGAVWLGTYMSKERAIAVIDKISNAIGLNMYTYSMPKK